MARLNLLIADGTEEFRLELVKALQNRYNIHCCENGAEAREYVRLHQPDVIVLDLMLTELDGISFLYTLAESGMQPMVLATTRLDTPYVVDTAEKLGVSYLIKKPCSPEAVAARVLDMSRRLEPKTPEVFNAKAFVEGLLNTLGCPLTMRGYPQLVSCILLYSSNSDMPITKVLYPSIAGAFQTSPPQVEHAVRSVITSAWNKRTDSVWAHYFPPDANEFIQKPSNSVFISRLATELRQKQNGTFF